MKLSFIAIGLVVGVTALGCAPTEPSEEGSIARVQQRQIPGGEYVWLFQVASWDTLQYEGAGLTGGPVITDFEWEFDGLWRLELVGSLLYRIHHGLHDDMYLDAYTSSDRDYNVTVRPYQNNDTQLWYIFSDAPLSNYYRILQKSSQRYLDSRLGSPPNRAMTKPAQNNDTQRWHIYWD